VVDEPFVLVVLLVAAVTLLANILLWVPLFGKIFWLIGKILRLVGFIVGVFCLWAAFVLLGWAPAPF
jgi:hypothetical protein